MTTINFAHPKARTWWRHTKKAIRKGHPADRLFAVIGSTTDDGAYLLAWKCTEVGPGQVSHPAFPSKLINLLDEEAFISGGLNGSKPTAMFRPDSFYEEIVL